MESDDEMLSLSSHALAALQEFKDEEKQRMEQLRVLAEKAQLDYEKQRQISIDAFQEDWQLSQFWYADDTAATLGRALLEGADENTVIAIASAPSVYAAMLKFPPEDVPTKHIYLFEYDKRFEVLAGKDHFFFYDYKHPDDIPQTIRHKVDRLLIDPPYLQKQCQTNSARAAYNLLKKDRTGLTTNRQLQYRLISCTGERMKHIVKETYPETRMTDFYPEHRQLSNEFRCYASFECEEWKFLPDDSQGDV